MPRQVFLSSRMADPVVAEIRAEVYEWARAQGQLVWVAEKCLPAEKAVPYEDIGRLCLSEVRGSDLVISILHQGYGDTSKYDPTGVSLLELEIFQAILARKPVDIYLLEPFDPDPRLDSLLRLVRSAIPSSIRSFPSRSHLVEHVKQKIGGRAQFSPTLGPRVLRHLITALGISRHPIGAESHFNRELRFLDNQGIPCAGALVIDKTVLKQALDQSRVEPNYYDRLLLAWKAIRNLLNVPFGEGVNSDYWPLWDEALSVWVSSGAWCGLHGHIFLGCVAAQNKLLEIREVAAVAEGTAKAEVHLLSTHGAIASEYYSISKKVTSRRLRRSLLYSALHHLDVAEAGVQRKVEDYDLSGLLGIRASVLVKVGRLGDAVHVYQRVLGIRESSGASQAEVGEAKSQLGYALLLRGKIREAGRYLEEGVEALERGKGAGFAIRAKKKLAAYYLAVGAARRAYRQLAEAEALVRYHGADDQVSGMLGLMRTFRALGVGAAGRLDVIVENSGYKYLEK